MLLTAEVADKHYLFAISFNEKNQIIKYLFRNYMVKYFEHNLLLKKIKNKTRNLIYYRTFSC